MSVAITAGPPVLVMIPTRLPFGIGCDPNATAALIKFPLRPEMDHARPS